jgi:hypothetical protein
LEIAIAQLEESQGKFNLIPVYHCTGSLQEIRPRSVFADQPALTEFELSAHVHAAAPPDFS